MLTEKKATHPHDIWPEFIDHLDTLDNVTVVQNKIDLIAETPALEEKNPGQPCPIVKLSAKQKQGIEILQAHLKTSVGISSTTEGSFIARRRHLDALERASEFLASGALQLGNAGAGELLAEDLRLTQQCLSEITGEFSSDDLLGEIFSSFCIGK